MQSWDPRTIMPGWHGPFDSYEAAFAYYKEQKAKPENSWWASPDLTFIEGTLPDPQTAGKAVKGAADVVGKAETAVAKGIIHTIFGDIDIELWAMRIAEILLGTVLIGVGLAKLTGTTNIVVKTLNTAVKTAAVVK